MLFIENRCIWLRWSSCVQMAEALLSFQTHRGIYRRGWFGLFERYEWHSLIGPECTMCSTHCVQWWHISVQNRLIVVDIVRLGLHAAHHFDSFTVPRSIWPNTNKVDFDELIQSILWYRRWRKSKCPREVLSVSLQLETLSTGLAEIAIRNMQAFYWSEPHHDREDAVDAELAKEVLLIWIRIVREIHCCSNRRKWLAS